MKEIRVLGTGCPKCEKLAAVAKEAAWSLGLDCDIKKITDITEIMAYRVFMTPALVVDGEVKVAGKVPSVDEVKKLLA
jgi:small redox-active disulfide protein 2